MNQDKIIDHFPLQSNLKKLKHNFQKLISAATVPIFILIQLGDKFFDKINVTQELIILLGSVAVFLLIIAAEFLTRGYYFNSFGVGVIKSFGNKSQWYSYDEMTDLKLKQKGIPGSKNSSTSIKMFFYSGKVSVDTNSFNKNGVEELAEIVKKKKPEVYGNKNEKVEDVLSQVKSNLMNEPQPGPLYGQMRLKKQNKKKTSLFS